MGGRIKENMLQGREKVSSDKRLAWDRKHTPLPLDAVEEARMQGRKELWVNQGRKGKKRR